MLCVSQKEPKLSDKLAGICMKLLRCETTLCHCRRKLRAQKEILRAEGNYACRRKLRASSKRASTEQQADRQAQLA